MFKYTSCSNKNTWLSIYAEEKHSKLLDYDKHPLKLIAFHLVRCRISCYIEQVTCNLRENRNEVERRTDVALLLSKVLNNRT